MLKQLIAKKFCRQCFGCCRFASRETVWRVHLLQKENKRLFGKDCELTILENPSQGNFICKFLNTKNNKCKVYTKRPLECQLYPFLVNRRGNKAFLALDLNCPFVKNNQKSPRMRDYSKYLIELFGTPRYATILRSNPQVIQEYKEVKDITQLQF